MGGSESGGGVDGVVTKSSGLHPKLALAVGSGVTKLKPGDRVCRRAKPSSTGVVLRLYDDADANPRYANMAQIDFSESKGSKVRVL